MGGGGGVLGAVLPCKWFNVSACGSICVYLSLRTMYHFHSFTEVSVAHVA